MYIDSLYHICNHIYWIRKKIKLEVTCKFVGDDFVQEPFLQNKTSYNLKAGIKACELKFFCALIMYLDLDKRWISNAKSIAIYNSGAKSKYPYTMYVVPIRKRYVPL